MITSVSWRLAPGKRILAIFCLLAAALPCCASRVVTDELGHKLTLPDHPHRVICLVPHITDDAFALGAADDVVAITDYVEFPAEAKRKPSVGSILEPSIEKIVSLHPDLILATPKFNAQATLDQLQEMGIPVFYVEPHGIAGILKTITFLGAALNRVPQAAALDAALERRIQAVHASVQSKPVVSVFMPVWYDPVITIGRGSFLTELIAAAGGHSVTDDLDQEWPHISMEAVIARAPQALVLKRNGKMTLAVLAGKPGWDALPAVRDHRVFYVDDRIEIPGPIAIEALEDLARQLHP